MRSAWREQAVPKVPARSGIGPSGAVVTGIVAAIPGASALGGCFPHGDLNEVVSEIYSSRARGLWDEEEWVFAKHVLHVRMRRGWRLREVLANTSARPGFRSVLT